MAQIIQLRRGNSAEWVVSNPVLAQGEIGIELNTGLFKVGNGIDNWNNLSYSTLRSIDEATIVNFSSSEMPTPPQPGKLNLLARPLAGRMLLRQQGPSGLSTPLQPSFFQNNIVMINTGATTAVQTLGNTVGSAGTVSHPTPVEQYGYMANFATAATALATAGTGNSSTLWVRGSTLGANGFFYNARLAYPDSSYNETGASTGTRTFVGLTNQALTVSSSADNPAGHYCGFMRRHTDTGEKDTNWKFVSKNNVDQIIVDTGLEFLPEKVYDFYIFCSPQGNEIHWRIDNITDGIIRDGSVTDNLPGNNIYMRGVLSLQTVNAVIRNIRMQRVYMESDR